MIHFYELPGDCYFTISEALPCVMNLKPKNTGWGGIFFSFS